jgi:hypothetical protein
MKNKYYLLSLIVCLVLMGCKKKVDAVVVSDDDAKEVGFEDVATNVRVVPLVSDEPIGSLRNIVCYGNELIAVDNDRKTFYYFVDGELVSRMNHAGRGRGEYLQVTRFAYSPSRKVIYVVTDNKILWYSVPGMNYCGSTPTSTNLNFLSLHDDDNFFAAINNNGRCITALVDIKTGEITKEIEEISMHNFAESNISMSSYSIQNHYYSKTDYNNSIVSVTTKNEVDTLLIYNFGDKSIPEKYLDYDSNDMLTFAKLFDYMDKNGRTTLLGNQFLKIRDKEISFWYYYAVGSNGVKFYYRYNPDDNKSVNLKGFRIKGINRPIFPFALSDNGYITLFEGDSSSYKTDEEPTPLAKSIIYEMENQPNNNPVLLFYDIR